MNKQLDTLLEETCKRNGWSYPVDLDTLLQMVRGWQHEDGIRAVGIDQAKRQLYLDLCAVLPEKVGRNTRTAMKYHKHGFNAAIDAMHTALAQYCGQEEL